MRKKNVNTPTMPKINRLAYIRGEERGLRYKYRHTPAGAANVTGIREEWILLWVATKLLKHQNWQKNIWVRVEQVEALAKSRRWMSVIVPRSSDWDSQPNSVAQFSLQVLQERVRREHV